MAWEQLLQIRREAVAMRADELSQPPTACPNDGEPLRQGANGVLWCPFDGWQYPRDHIGPSR